VASQSVPIPSRQAHRQSRVRAFVRAPSLPLRAAAIALVAIIIVFRWLHLIVSLQVASTDRQIQMSSDELARYERGNAALQCGIAEAASPRLLAARARELGYQPQTPAYVPAAEPISPSGSSDIAVPSGAEQVLLELLTPAASQRTSDRTSNPSPQAQASR
jgi:hypothetical protein